jgi:hypothetical protein
MEVTNTAIASNKFQLKSNVYLVLILRLSISHYSSNCLQLVSALVLTRSLTAAQSQNVTDSFADLIETCGDARRIDGR